MNFHAHLFFAPSDQQTASWIREQMISQLPESVRVGPLLLRAAGPLPLPMFQLEYGEEFSQEVRQVMENCRRGRSVLIHPLLADEVAAHTVHAVWLGEPLPLRLDHL